MNGRPRLGVCHPGLLVALAADPDLHDSAIGLVRVQADDAALGIFRGNAQVVYDLLHPTVRIVHCREKVVEARDVVVNDASLFEIEFYQITQRDHPRTKR